ncbi:DsbA family protein [Rhodopseudomonas palustris]|uniref:DsbA family protein n=1 Tax=Rhodopseudomonas palustris TaxID=1076 RepID=UPI00115D5491|nr:DsbA family protein [Rhodopseudomonas palustris]QDL96032.1 DsbA family protein [Rhodopseudomonas palustris]
MMITRRSALTATLALAPGLAAAAAWGAPAVPDSEDVLSTNAVLYDAEIPVAGNPNGDITIVEWSDYRCSYCKKVAPDLMQVVNDDGRIRLVLKDWPIFGGVSVDAAKMVLAAKYQGKFLEAHQALIGAPSKLTDATLKASLEGGGVDVGRATRDLDANRAAIEAILKRNDAQAKAFGFQGTPSFIIGRFRVPGVLDVALFKQAIKDAREAAKKTDKK